MRNSSQLAAKLIEHGRAPECPIIDTHGHYGYFSGIYFPSPLEEGMLRSMDRCGIRTTVISSHAALADAIRGNKVTEKVVTANPGRFLGYWTINPHYPELHAADFDSFGERRGFVGFKFHPDGHKYPLTGDGYKRALQYADAHGKLILLHTWGHSENDGPAVVEETALKYPNATFIMGHSGYGQWERTLETLRKCPNVFTDLCAAGSVYGVIDMLCGEVGSHRVLFGTDLPWFDPHFLMGCICSAHINDDERLDIFYRNAEKLLSDYLA